MRMVRMFGSGLVLSRQAFFAVAMLPGCDSGGGSSESGNVIKVDKAEVENRAAKIREMYKANPPGKGTRGEVPLAPRQNRLDRMGSILGCSPARWAPFSDVAVDHRFRASWELHGRRRRVRCRQLRDVPDTR